MSEAIRPDPFSRRVIFAPQLHGQRLSAEAFLILDCGHSIEWAAEPIPGYIACKSCASASAPAAPTRVPRKPTARRGSGAALHLGD
jgi:hypothetical protein